MANMRILAVLLLVLGLGVGYIVYESQPGQTVHTAEDQSLISFERPFALGLDLAGGTHLIYRADVSHLPESEVSRSMESLRDVIERRVNLFGVSEPNVQVEEGSVFNDGENRLIVDLPGVTDVAEATEMIGRTPLLEFKVENPDFQPGEQSIEIDGSQVSDDGTLSLENSDLPSPYQDTELTGRYVDGAQLQFQGGQTGGQGGAFSQPVVVLQFNSEGQELFADITREHTGETVAIYLDGEPISTPVVREPITAGEAVISGDFSAEEAKELVGRINSGALPVPIELISTQTIGASLGAQALKEGVVAGLIGFLLVVAFLLLWYRIPGLIAGIALSIYVALILGVFKLIPVTITAAGIAGFIISLGIAVDANILIFERMREEIEKGATLPDAVRDGFTRAWASIRDSNISSILSAAILFWFGTSLIKGFALTFGIGVLVSMLSAVVVSRVLLLAVSGPWRGGAIRVLFTSGFSKKQ